MNFDWSLLFNIVVVVNAVLAIFTVFREKRDIAAIWAWLLVLVFLPLVGFIAYAFLGRKLPKTGYSNYINMFKCNWMNG